MQNGVATCQLSLSKLPNIIVDYIGKLQGESREFVWFKNQKKCTHVNSIVVCRLSHPSLCIPKYKRFTCATTHVYTQPR